MSCLAALCRTVGAGQHRALFNRSSWLHTASPCYAKSAEERLGLEKPKRPLTPFIKFATEMRPALQAKSPSTGVIQAMKLASKHWHQLDSEVKTKMTKEYSKDMEDYRKIKSVYDASLTDAQKEDIRRVRVEIAAAKEKRKVKAEYKELGRPKRPMSSYMLFCQQSKETIKELGMKEFQNRMKDKWNSLPQAEKAKWEEKALGLMNRYRKEMQAWEEKMISEGHVEYVRTGSLPAKTRPKEAKEPKK